LADPGMTIKEVADVNRATIYRSALVATPKELRAGEMRPRMSRRGGRSVRATKPDSHWPRRWREVDSNHRFLVRRSRFLLRKANCGGSNGGGLLKLFFLGGTAGLNPHTP